MEITYFTRYLIWLHVTTFAELTTGCTPAAAGAPDDVACGVADAAAAGASDAVACGLD